MGQSSEGRSIGAVALALAFLGCASAHRSTPAAHERVGVAQTAPPETPGHPSSPSERWVELETLSVELHTGRVRPRAAGIERRHARIHGDRIEFVQDEKIVWSVNAPTSYTSTFVADDAVIAGNGSALRGFDGRTGALLWTVQEQATSFLQWFAADDALHLPEIVVGVDARAAESTGAHRTLVARAIATGGEIFRHPLQVADRPVRTSVIDGRILVVEGTATATVVDVDRARSSGRKRKRLPLGLAQTFEKSVRWVGGYRWSSGDLLVSSDKRLARIEFQSTLPEYNGSTVWSLPPVPGERGGALLTGAVERSPNEVKKYACFYGYEPDRDTPVALAFVEALARGEDGTVPRARYRGSVEPLSTACGPREVRVVDDGDAVLVIVACERGAVVERRSVPGGMLVGRVEGRS